MRLPLPSFLLAPLLAVLLPGAAPQPDMQTQLQQAEQRAAAQQHAAADARRQEAEAAARQSALAARRVAAAASLRSTEQATEAAAARLQTLATQRRSEERRLARLSARLGPLLPLIERLALYPTETLLAQPLPPQTALQGLAVLHGLARSTEAEAEQAVASRTEIDRLTQAIAAETPVLRAAQQRQQQQEAALDAEIAAAAAERSTAERAADAAGREAAQAAATATTLRGAIAAIEQARQHAAEAVARDAARAARTRQTARAATLTARAAALSASGPGLDASLALAAAPVAGPLLRHFGDPTEAGPAEGLSFAPPPGARVVSPCEGRVLFAGPFRSYGRLVIVDCGKGYDFVLAGLDRLDVAAGRSVQKGEPVGIMPSWDPEAGAARPALYVELRHAGRAIDPAPYLRGRA